MKKFSVLLISIVCIGFYFSNTSCNRNEYSEQIVIVDSLNNVASVYLFQLDSIDSSAIMGMENMILEDISWISDSLAKENLTQSTVFLAKLKNGRKVIQVFPREYNTLRKELNISLGQLKDLKTDLDNGNVNKELANKYVNDEELAMKKIDAHHKKLLKRLNSLNNYEEVRKEFYLEARK